MNKIQINLLVVALVMSAVFTSCHGGLLDFGHKDEKETKKEEHDNINKDDLVEKLEEPTKDYLAKLIDAGVSEGKEKLNLPGFVENAAGAVIKDNMKEFVNDKVENFVEAHDSDEEVLAKQKASEQQHLSRKKRGLDEFELKHELKHDLNSVEHGVRPKKSFSAIADQGLQTIGSFAGRVHQKLADPHSRHRLIAKAKTLGRNKQQGLHGAQGAHGAHGAYGTSSYGVQGGHNGNFYGNEQLGGSHMHGQPSYTNPDGYDHQSHNNYQQTSFPQSSHQQSYSQQGAGFQQSYPQQHQQSYHNDY